MNRIETIEQYRELVKRDVAVLLKHSITCPISRTGYDEFTEFVTLHPTVDHAMITVQESRELSNYIAESTGVRHETPQVLVFRKGIVVWHASHRKITAESIAEALSKDS